jgi:hypothetical protein
MLLRKHSKKGFDVTKAKGRKSFLREMRKRVPTPVPQITKVQGQEVVRFSFLEMLHDLLSSTKFQDIDNLCANRDRFRFLLDEDLDEHQLDLFMIASWAILRNIRGKPHHSTQIASLWWCFLSMTKLKRSLHPLQMRIEGLQQFHLTLKHPARLVSAILFCQGTSTLLPTMPRTW